MSYDKTSVKEELTLEDIYSLLEYIGAEPRDEGDALVCKTICHNGNSHKLYYYDNTQLFKCYSGDCGSFDIFELISKIKNIDLNTSIYYVVNYFNLQHRLDEVEENSMSEDWKLFKRWNNLDDSFSSNDKIVLNEIEKNILDFYPQPACHDWTDEFITKEVMDYMNIRYNPLNGSLLIPHYDENGRMIGIRERTLVKEDEVYGKYHPARIDGKQRNHPLGFNLYGLDKAKDRIGEIGVAIVGESEKFVLQSMSYLGVKNNISVGMCGSTLSNYQFNLLLDAGAKEICIAVDRDFKELYDDEYFKVLKKMEKMYQKYSPSCNISFMFDTKGLTGYKMSPTDCGRNIFMDLWRERLVPNG